ncbi:MAG: DUF3575 domain-containing protein [Sediminibacterium sp.]|nr:DUF3575 domain-containing protein [Sediminibacterium sp.]
MNKSFLLSIILISTTYSCAVFGQNNFRMMENNFNKPVKNEIRFNMLSSMLGLLELNYERFLSDNSGLGVSTVISLENKDNATIRSMAVPYFRVYFGNGFASGAYIEANAAVAREVYPYYTYNSNGMGWSNKTYQYETTFGLGTSIGYKMVRRNGIVGEFSLGLGRLFGNSYAELYPRVGICIGKRW